MKLLKSCKCDLFCHPWSDFVLVVTAALLFLAKLGYINEPFVAWVDTYWAMGLLVYAVMVMAAHNGK